jgi:ABC-2 type transport system ATP-binding protein
MKLNATNLQKSFNSKPVLTGASYTFEKGKIYGLLGRNGAGKTTMFNCLTGNIPLDGGEVTITETKLTELTELTKLTKLDGNPPRKTTVDDIGFVFTQPHLPEFMTGHEFIKFFIDINKDKISRNMSGGDSFSKSFAELFSMVGLELADTHKLIREYSHGMQNKLQLLAFLILRPPVILLDEPLTSFDVVVALQIKNLIKSLKNDHIIIFSSHILELVQDLCDEIVILHNGKLSTLDSGKLGDKDFESQILAMLTEEADDDDD